ncbi:flavin-dependent oxidoreductase [Ferrovibrio terrae]|uniref:flavin-dependent oxidoreductase n=1 Tax=Ferrovibrio terrae TaxID=2594003 RepID=UPI0031381BDB
MDVLIIGGGIGGLTLALTLHERGIPCRVFEMAPQIKAVGVGVNLLPHSTKELIRLGLESELARVAVATKDAAFFNRFGQLIHREPLGRAAGYDWPQFSIHRGDLQMILLAAVEQRLGKDRIHTGWQCTGFSQDARQATAQFRDTTTGAALPDQSADVIVACDGIHSAIRKQMHPQEGEPRYSGVNMWRGVTRMQPILSGACMVRAGWLSHGKMVIYPIRDTIDAAGNQLMNWVAEIETPVYRKRDWSRPGNLDDFLPAFADWTFDWLDVPKMIRDADMALEFPMVDQDPLDHWTEGRVTLLGDAAHPMVPRGSNGAGQAIIDCAVLADLLAETKDPVNALQAYEALRLPATAQVVLTNRTNPPDAILREVFERTGDKPFARIEDVISPAELTAITDSYKRVAGYDREKLKAAG